MISAQAKEQIRQFLPPIIWNYLASKVSHTFRDIDYQGVRTPNIPWPMHNGRFAEIYEKNYKLDPYVNLNVTRYRIYNICMIANLCLKIPGDFLSAGVSFGVAQKIVFDFIDLNKYSKILHMIDPFIGISNAENKRYYFNTDFGLVDKQYNTRDHVKFHLELIPNALSKFRKTSIAFAFLNTSNVEAECASLPILFDMLYKGGAIMIDQYCPGNGNYEAYNPVFEKLGVIPFWFPSGQCVIFK